MKDYFGTVVTCSSDPSPGSMFLRLIYNAMYQLIATFSETGNTKSIRETCTDMQEDNEIISSLLKRRLQI